MSNEAKQPPHLKALGRAIDVIGGQAALARILADRTDKPIRQGHIWGWINRSKKIPPELASHIEAVTTEAGEKVSRQDLCPEFPWDIEGTS